MEMDNLRGLREAGENILRGVSTRNRMKLTHAQVVSIDSESPQLICIEIHLFILLFIDVNKYWFFDRILHHCPYKWFVLQIPIHHIYIIFINYTMTRHRTPQNYSMGYLMVYSCLLASAWHKHQATLKWLVFVCWDASLNAHVAWVLSEILLYSVFH